MTRQYSVADLLAPNLNRLPIKQDPNVSLTRTKKDKETGEEVVEQALFWMIDGTILVHPERWDAFMAELKDAGVVMK